MCGIIGYIGNRKASDIILKGLTRLEYRGYDSAGISTIEDSRLQITKCSGKISDLQKSVNKNSHNGNIGIGHTRCATHGEPSTANSHPHNDYNNKISIIHNCIIEIYFSIKQFLLKKNINFKSDTDTETLVHLISHIHDSNDFDFEESFKLSILTITNTTNSAMFGIEKMDFANLI